jgi:hypothetical protein
MPMRQGRRWHARRTHKRETPVAEAVALALEKIRQASTWEEIKDEFDTIIRPASARLDAVVKLREKTQGRMSIQQREDWRLLTTGYLKAMALMREHFAPRAHFPLVAAKIAELDGKVARLKESLERVFGPGGSIFPE